MRTVAPGRRDPTEQATNGAWKRDWLAHVCSSNSATHRACSTIRKHDGNEALFRQLVLLSINVQNYETVLQTCPSSQCLFPSDDLICSVIGHAKCAIYTVCCPTFLCFDSNADSRTCSIPTSLTATTDQKCALPPHLVVTRRTRSPARSSSSRRSTAGVAVAAKERPVGGRGRPAQGSSSRTLRQPPLFPSSPPLFPPACHSWHRCAVLAQSTDMFSQPFPTFLLLSSFPRRFLFRSSLRLLHKFRSYLRLVRDPPLSGSVARSSFSSGYLDVQLHPSLHALPTRPRQRQRAQGSCRTRSSSPRPIATPAAPSPLLISSSPSLLASQRRNRVAERCIFAVGIVRCLLVDWTASRLASHDLRACEP
ncbi:hypothetical protein AAT19DRAFT_13092 [Rhodotorula toruloides]|uniref:Uncharacterized protein n=1 Tax=Rhodotorula toruloides TaxID=5286 RepID=A0A2T0ADJ3_RHOTO|nr:hypothetical protein AAT19DRAFT_13092 [Rhodotorula toruloides]